MEFERLSPVFLMQFKNSVERILHVKGNYNGGILEMALVVDHNLTKEQVAKIMPQLLRTLKMHSEVFRNVRLNVTDWKGDGQITNRVSPISMAMLPGFYEDYEQHTQTKDFGQLVQYLKVFQARAKLVIVLTDGAYEKPESELLRQAMQPFLEKKLMQVIISDSEMIVQYR